jgi:uncharacterized protein YdaU (DUF1376 family)
MNLQRGFFVVGEARVRDNRESNSEREPLATDIALLTTSAVEEQDMAVPKSSTGKSPAFQFYPDDFLADANVIVMSMAERGIYITLISVCWQQGSLPADTAMLSRLCLTPLATFKKMWPAVERCFRLKGERLVHPRLDLERRKQAEYRAKQAENGKKGGRPEKPKETQPLAVGNSGLTQTEPKKSSSSSSSSSSSDFRQERAEHARAAGIEIKPTSVPKPSSPDDLGLRAGRFCDRYAELHEKFRHGARLVGKPAFRSALGGGNMDFLEAMELVKVWDDARLDKLAELFLRFEGDDWIDSGPRTIARFRSRATWCDDRLKQVESKQERRLA